MERTFHFNSDPQSAVVWGFTFSIENVKSAGNPRWKDCRLTIQTSLPNCQITHDNSRSLAFFDEKCFAPSIVEKSNLIDIRLSSSTHSKKFFLFFYLCFIPITPSHKRPRSLAHIARRSTGGTRELQGLKWSEFMERGRLARTWVCGRRVRKYSMFSWAGGTPANPGADETSALPGTLHFSWQGETNYEVTGAIGV